MTPTTLLETRDDLTYEQWARLVLKTAHPKMTEADIRSDINDDGLLFMDYDEGLTANDAVVKINYRRACAKADRVN